MKRLAVAIAATLVGSLLVAPGRAAAADEPLKTLAAAARGGNGPLIGSAMRHSAMGDDAYKQRAAQEFSLIAPESEFVWASVNRGADPANPLHGTYGFDRLDPIVDFAKANNQTIIGQHLAWHTDIPSWVYTQAVDAASARALLKNHIETLVGQYADDVDYWSVVNEPFNDEVGGGRRNTLWQDKIGDSYIAEAFQWAHEADPTAKLYINEYGAETDSLKARQLYDLVKQLKAAGVPIHGVGFQTHRMLTDGLPDFADMLRRFADLGVEVYVTEVDVRIPDEMTSGAELQQQADVFGQATTACLAVSACKFINFWGFTDKYHWIKMIRPTWGRATLLTDQLDEKPAYDRVAAELATWSKPVTDPVGSWRLDDWVTQGQAGSKASDSSGNGHTATAGAALGYPGRSPSHRAFRGDGATTQAVTASTVLRTDQSFSVSAWVSLDSTTQDQVVVSQDASTRVAFSLGYRAAEQKWFFSMADADDPSAGYQQVLSTANAQPGVWTHLTAVFNHGWGNRMLLYVDGKWNIPTTTPAITTPWTSPGVLRIGAAANGRHFTGGISDVRAYQRALPDADALKIADPAMARFALNGDTGDDSWFMRAGSPRPEQTLWLGPAGQRPTALRMNGGVVANVDAFAIDVRRQALYTDRSYSITAWMNLDADGDGARDGAESMVAVGQDGVLRSAFRFGLAGRRWAFSIPTADSNAGSVTLQSVATASDAALGWTHVAAVYDAGTGQLRLYVNGQLQSSLSGVSSWAANKTLHIGHALEGLRFVGGIDDVRLFQKPLSAAEISAISGERL